MALDSIEDRQTPQKTFVPTEDGEVSPTARRIRANLGNIEDLELSLPNPHTLTGKTLSFVSGVDDDHEGETGSLKVEGENIEKTLDTDGDALLLQSDGDRWFVISETEGSGSRTSSRSRTSNGSRTNSGS